MNSFLFAVHGQIHDGGSDQGFHYLISDTPKSSALGILVVRYLSDDPYAKRSSLKVLQSIRWNTIDFAQIDNEVAAAITNYVGIYYYYLGEFRTALNLFKEANKRYPGDGYYYTNIADSLEEIGQANDALHHMAQAPKEVAAHPYFQNSYAFMAERHSQYETVIELLTPCGTSALSMNTILNYILFSSMRSLKRAGLHRPRATPIDFIIRPARG